MITEQLLEQRIREAVAAEGARHARYRDVLMRGARAALQYTREAKAELEAALAWLRAPDITEGQADVENALGRVATIEAEFEILLAGLESDWVKPTPAPDPAGVSR